MPRTQPFHKLFRRAKVSELVGAPLDHWVAQAEGVRAIIRHYPGDGSHPIDKCRRLEANCSGSDNESTYRPSADWAQGGPIIEREGISLLQIGLSDAPDKWSANFEQWHEDREDRWTAPTPLIAAMRAFIASKFGDTVPDEPA